MVDEPSSRFMNRDVLFGDQDMPLAEVIAQMAARAKSAFVVCDGTRPLGVITERDALDVLDHTFRGKHFEDLCARDVMACPAHTLPQSASMFEVMRVMNERRFRRVPITNDDDELVGIVNLEELQAAMNSALEHRGRDLEAAVAARTAELQAANERLEALSMADGLTGLLNRRAMQSKLEEVHDLARRHGHPYSVILIDIDHFKAYNDTFGHVEGDEAIRKVAARLDSAVRVSDSVFRYGGEEFLAVLPEAVSEGVASFAERIRQAMEELAIPHPASATAPVLTVSIGYASLTSETKVQYASWRDVVEEADRALYHAKQTGRNRIAGPQG